MPFRVQARRKHRFSEWTLSEVLELQGARIASLRSPSAKLARSASVLLPCAANHAASREAKSQEGRCHDKTYGLRFVVQPKGSWQLRSQIVVEPVKSRVQRPLCCEVGSHASTVTACYSSRSTTRPAPRLTSHRFLNDGGAMSSPDPVLPQGRFPVSWDRKFVRAALLGRLMLSEILR
jgi:hypothetical protein